MQYIFGLFFNCVFALFFFTSFATGMPLEQTAQQRAIPLLVQPAEKSRLGMNAGIGALDWDPSEMFADVMKTFREVKKPDGATPAALDLKGWPLEDCRFLVWHGLNRKAGTYRLRFTGRASSIFADGSTIRNILYSEATNTTTADVVFDGSNYMYLAFTGTNGGVKNVRLMMPGHSFGEIWNRDFLAALAPVPVIRFMDFAATNWNHDVNWSDRTLPNVATQQSHPDDYGWQGKGIAWEYAIDLMNRTDKDGWINIPAEATDAYVNALINLIKNGGNGFAPLEQERKLYIEFSNEVWNGIFDQTIYNYEQAVAEVDAGDSPLNFDGETNAYYWAWRRIGKRIIEISGQFRATFGNDQMMTRFRPVLAWQYDNGQATAIQQLNFIQRYYGTNKWGYTEPHPVNHYLWCGGGALYYDDIPVNQDQGFRSAVETDSKLASAYGINYCNYEGGIYFDGQDDPDWFQPWVTQNILDHQRYYEQHGGKLLMYFTLTATWENGLGFLRTVRDLETPKYDAILQLSKQTHPWTNTFGALLPMYKDGADFSLTNSWHPSGTGAATLWPKEMYAYHFDVNTYGKYRIWIQYRSSSNIDLNIYAGSELVGTITENTGGNPSVSPKYIFNSTAGLKAIRLENHGRAEFEIISVNVELVPVISAFFNSNDAQDGWVLESGENTGLGGIKNNTAALRLGDNAAGKQYLSILSFDTSSLPDDAVITKVALRVRKQDITGEGDPVTAFQGFMADIRKGTFGLPALQISDFQGAGSKTYGPFSPALVSDVYSFDLTVAKGYINKLSALSGLTQLRLRFKLDDNNDSVADYLSLFSGEAEEAYRPQLIIQYYVP
jgi:hypothetical protein